MTDVRDPVNLYYLEKVADLETDVAQFEAATADPSKKKHPYAGEIKKVRKHLEHSRQMWARASQTPGVKWIQAFKRAKEAHNNAEQLWLELAGKQ